MAEVINMNQIIKRPSHNPNGRPISVPWRFNEDGELIIKNPTWSDYKAYNYKHKYGLPVQCAFCKRTVVLDHLKRHYNSKRCQKSREQLDTKS